MKSAGTDRRYLEDGAAGELPSFAAVGAPEKWTRPVDSQSLNGILRQCEHTRHVRLQAQRAIAQDGAPVPLAAIGGTQHPEHEARYRSGGGAGNAGGAATN